MTQAHPPTLPATGKRCPDIATCHTARLGAGGLVFCLSEDRIFCDYTLPFGTKFFCTNPSILDSPTTPDTPAAGQA